MPLQGAQGRVDGAAFAKAWRAGYQPAMEPIRAGRQPWTRLDDLHRSILDGILKDFGVTSLTESQKQHLNLVWHRLHPWPEAAAGLARLKTRFTLATLSNGNISLLTHLSKFGALPFDCILGAEVYQSYKPQPAMYLGAARSFDLAPEQVMLVAAHHEDLAAARACGLQTAYIERPWEFGRAAAKNVSPVAANTWHARDFHHLADQLGCA
jgi:2-haloacid dehalogenase